MNGLFVIEGIDGCGKGLLIKNLVLRLRKKAVYLKEPSESLAGKKLMKTYHEGRLSREEEYELFLMDRKENIEENILPALESGKIVVLDRYYHSTIAYQGALGIPVEKIIADNIKLAPKPEKVFILDVSIEESAKRIESRINTFENPDYLRKVREIYLSLPEILDESIMIIDGTMDPLKIADIVEKEINGKE